MVNVMELVWHYWRVAETSCSSNWFLFFGFFFVNFLFTLLYFTLLYFTLRMS